MRINLISLLTLVLINSNATANTNKNKKNTNQQKSDQSVEWKIGGESSSIDLRKQKIIYKGNAYFTTNDIEVTGDKIQANQDAINKLSKNITITGSPARLNQSRNIAEKKQSFELKASSIKYNLVGNQLNADQQVKLTLQQNQTSTPQPSTQDNLITISADTLASKGTNNLTLNFSGTPIKLNIQQPNQPPLYAEAKFLSFDQVANLFEISGNVTLTTGNEIIKAEKLIYNNTTQFIQIPQGSESFEMSQQAESNNE